MTTPKKPTQPLVFISWNVKHVPPGKAGKTDKTLKTEKEIPERVLAIKELLLRANPAIVTLQETTNALFVWKKNVHHRCLPLGDDGIMLLWDTEQVTYTGGNNCRGDKKRKDLFIWGHFRLKDPNPNLLEFTFIGVYGDPQYGLDIKILDEKMKEKTSGNVLVMGDFNMTLPPRKLEVENKKNLKQLQQKWANKYDVTYLEKHLPWTDSEAERSMIEHQEQVVKTNVKIYDELLARDNYNRFCDLNFRMVHTFRDNQNPERYSKVDRILFTQEFAKLSDKYLGFTKGSEKSDHLPLHFELIPK